MSFLRDSNGQYSQIVMSGAPTSTIAQGINNSGAIVGFYHPNNGPFAYQGFVDINGTYTTINDPLTVGSYGTIATGINNQGEIVGNFEPVDNGEPQGFLLDTLTGQYTTINIPGSLYTEIFGINDAGEIVGQTYFDGQFEGFVGIPAPEPSTFLMAIMGVLSVAGYIWLTQRKTLAAASVPLPELAKHSTS